MVLPKTTLFPGSTQPLCIKQPSHVKLVRDVLEGERFLVLANKHSSDKFPCRVSGVGIIRAGIKMNKSYCVVIQGLARVSLESRLRALPYPIYQVSPLEPKDPEDSAILQILASQLKDKVIHVIKGMKIKSFGTIHKFAKMPSPGKDENAPMDDFLSFIKGIKHPGALADFVASTLIVPGDDRQSVLDACPVMNRLMVALKIFSNTYDTDDLDES